MLQTVDFEHIPRPVVVTGQERSASFGLDWHSHRRGQFLYAAKGVIVVRTLQGAWVAPPERAIWTPGGVLHAAKMVGAVSSRKVMIDPEVCRAGDDRSRVVDVSPLLRSLLLEASEIVPEYDLDGRDAIVMSLLVAEVDRAPEVPLTVTFPANALLAEKCRAFLEQPSPHDTLDGWSADLGMPRRTFTRLFRQETGMSFSEWRQQACILIALPRLAAGDPVTTVALDLGYDSPASFSTMFKRVLRISPSRYKPAA
jgi:AraC-like DNA-binding protein